MMAISTESFLRQTETAPVGFLRFIKIKAKFLNKAICFFEGEDAKYYSSRISAAIDDHWEPVRCGGKQAVIKIHDMIHNHESYNLENTFYFIDRDFDQTTPTTTVFYTTPCYSIENLYTSETALERILKHCFGLSLGDEKDEVIFQRAMELFREFQKQFHQAIGPLNAWIQLISENRDRTDHEQTSWKALLGIPADKIKKLVKLNKDEIRREYSLTTLCQNVSGITEQAVQEKLETIPVEDRGTHFRGKFELEFLLWFLQTITDDLNGKLNLFKFKRKISYKPTKNPSEALSSLSSYADTPPCLRFFTEKMRQSY